MAEPQHAELEVIEGTLVPAAPVPMPSPGVLSLFGDTPGEALKRVNELADAIRGEIEKNGWVAELKFSGRVSKHVTIEGWQFAGGLAGVFAVITKTERIKIDGVPGWEAHAEARTIAGQVVGGSDGMCMKDEARWGAVDEYARRSMAQTRAMSRALAGPLRFIVQKAGFDGTPWEDAEGVERVRSGDAAGGARTADRGDTKGRTSGPKKPSPAQLKMAADKLVQVAALNLTDAAGEIITAERILRDACAKFGVTMVEPDQSETWIVDTLGRFTGGMGGQISDFIDRMKAALK